MKRLKHNYFIKLVVSLFIIAIGITQVEAALKGTPGSSARQEWCKSKMDSCVEDAITDCDDTHYSGSTEGALCKSSEVNVCKNAYGSSSDCLTRDRVGSHSNKTERVGGNEKVARTTETVPSRRGTAPSQEPIVEGKEDGRRNETVPASRGTSNSKTAPVRSGTSYSETVPARKGTPISKTAPVLRATLAAPSQVMLGNVQRTSLTLVWMDNSSLEYGVAVERGSPTRERGGVNYNWKRVFNVEERVKSRMKGTGLRSDTDDGLSPGTDYCYRLRAYRDGTFSDYSDPVCARTQ